MALNGDKMFLVRCDDYLVGVADSSESAAQMISDYGVGEVYTLDYIEESMGLGYTDYEVYYRELVGDMDSDTDVYVTYGDDIEDRERKVLVCGSYDQALETLASELRISEDDATKAIEDGTAEIHRLALGELTDDLSIESYDLY